MKTELQIDEQFIFQAVKEKLIKDKLLERNKYSYAFENWHVTDVKEGTGKLSIKVIGTPKPKPIKETPYKIGSWKEDEA